jgi:hypothetical protein
MEKHNHYAIVAAVFLHQVLGFVWYSALLFGPMWAAGTGRAPDQMPGFLAYVAAVFAATLLCYLMSWLFQVLVVDDWRRGLAIGLLIGCGFIAPMIIMHYMFLGFPYVVIMVDSMKEVVGAGLTGVLLSTWRAEPAGEIAA